MALIKKKGADVSEGFRRDLVDGREAILDVPRLPQYPRELQNRVINLRQNGVSGSSASTVVASFQPV